MSTIAQISDVVAFAASNAAFTDLILFSETEVPEVRPEQRPAIEAVREHVLDTFVALLEACRDDMLARAIDPVLKATMERNWNRPSSIRDRKRVELSMLTAASNVEMIYFWIDEEPTRAGRLSLVGEVWVQARRRDPLLEVAGRSLPRVILTPDENLRVLGNDLVEGAELAALARDLVDVLWTPAIDVREGLLAQKRTKDGS
jgi:hypothetical protein